MALAPLAANALALEARALLVRLAHIQPFALVMPMVGAAGLSRRASSAIEYCLIQGRRDLRLRIVRYLRWLYSPAGRRASAAEAQKGFAFLKLKFNAVLTQFDIFSDALAVRSEVGNGTWLGGLDAAAEDALSLRGRFFDPPPVITYLDRGHGAAIRRARTRLPGGGENPVAVVRVPRERMIGSGIASSLIHEVGHQGAALLDLAPMMRREILARRRWTCGHERTAWIFWERWIWEILADFWSLAELGITATRGLMGVVSLPRAFVFRMQMDDPHPFPFVRVKLSTAAGGMLFPDPQWQLLDRLWESFYPRVGLDSTRLRILASLENTMPEFLRLLLHHRPESLRGLSLARAFPIAERQPQRLRQIFRSTGGRIPALRRLPPTLAFAVLGQALHDGRISPERESRVLAALLTRWGLRRALGNPMTAAQASRARVA